MATVMVVEIRWFDASIHTDDFKQKEAQKTKPVDRWTTGYLVEENKDCVVLATDYFVKKKDGYSGKLVIPWGMITEYWYY